MWHGFVKAIFLTVPTFFLFRLNNYVLGVTVLSFSRTTRMTHRINDGKLFFVLLF